MKINEDMDQPIAQARDITKTFTVGQTDVPVLRGISFDVWRGDFLVFFGPSGCGKSTLLHSMLGLEPPTTGSMSLFGRDLYRSMDEDGRSDLRKRHVGMVYQQSNWIRSLSVLENVAFPLILLGESRPEALSRAEEALDLTGMTGWASYVPSELSSGQQQRVSLSRAIVTDPDLIIADEPTGNLDFEAGQALMSLLRYFNDTEKKTIVMVTHDLEYLDFAKTAIRMLDGAVAEVYDEDSRRNLLDRIRGKRGVGYVPPVSVSS
jgi:putative ABC transport system ATP-binding protein